MVCEPAPSFDGSDGPDNPGAGEISQAVFQGLPAPRERSKHARGAIRRTLNHQSLDGHGSGYVLGGRCARASSKHPGRFGDWPRWPGVRGGGLPSPVTAAVQHPGGGDRMLIRQGVGAIGRNQAEGLGVIRSLRVLGFQCRDGSPELRRGSLNAPRQARPPPRLLDSPLENQEAAGRLSGRVSLV